MDFKVVCLAYFIQGTFATILNFHEVKNGTCDSETFKADIFLDCDVTVVKINIVTKHGDNLLAQCSKSHDMLGCHPDITANTTYNESSNILTFSTKFNHTKHAGNKLWINSTCSNETANQESVLLKPCVTGFKVSGQHNTTHVTISCEHLSFKVSVTGIHIHGKETLATCLWNKTSQEHRCTQYAMALPNGVQYITPYKPGMEISCSLDGQKIPITIQKQQENLHNKGGNQTTDYKSTPIYGSGEVRKAWPVFVTIGFSALAYYFPRDVFI